MQYCLGDCVVRTCIKSVSYGLQGCTSQRRRSVTSCFQVSSLDTCTFKAASGGSRRAAHPSASRSGIRTPHNARIAIVQRCTSIALRRVHTGPPPQPPAAVCCSTTVVFKPVPADLARREGDQVGKKTESQIAGAGRLYAKMGAGCVREALSSPMSGQCMATSCMETMPNMMVPTETLLHLGHVYICLHWGGAGV